MMESLNAPWGTMIVGLVMSILLAQSLALEVTRDSPCYSTCKGGLTVVTDLICSDSQYNTSSKGNAMKSCLLCESTSTTYSNATENDLLWFLFNQKYTVQHCLFEETPEGSLSGCEDQCSPLQSMLTKTWYPSRIGDKSPLYDYCRWNDHTLEKYWEGCAACMRGKKGSFVIGNFLENIGTACEAKPSAADGETLELKNPLFATSIESQTSTSAARAPTTTRTDRPSETSSAESPEPSDTSSGLSTGAKAGIGVGVGVGGLAILLAIGFFIWRNRRKQPQEMAQAAHSHRGYYKDSNVYSQHGIINEVSGTPRSELPT